MIRTGGTAPLLEVRQLGMRFGSIVALHDVSLQLNPGQVLCLLGDNGAGKSTLIKILSGVLAPTRGEFWIRGMPAAFTSPRAAAAHGIAAVHQDLALLPLMSVWRNFFLGREPTRGRGPARRIDVRYCRDTTRAQLHTLGIMLRDIDQPVATLSGGERQSVAIARALHCGTQILILDEPTAALGVRQTAMVLEAIDRVRQRGVAVIFITHNPRQAYPVGDRYVVLRRGRLVADLERAEVTPEALARLMGGEGEGEGLL